MHRLFINLFLVLGVSFFPFEEGRTQTHQFPFSTDSTYITVWNGTSYSPLFIKGINLGIATPGTFPGQLEASKEDYLRWFRLIREAGFNTIRVYTLHYPAFFEALDQFNRQHPNAPLLVFQGVWLEEEIPDYDENLFSLTEFFEQEIRENIDAVHGNAQIEPRLGKAHGTFSTDISEWIIGYIIGREIHPPEVLHTNELFPNLTSFEGNYLSISDAKASEVWLLQRIDFLLSYEWENYQTQRPISASSWPTLDPLSHPFEENQYEVSASIDFSEVDAEKAKAGFFVSYHAYPYYPNYISRDPNYVGFYDHLGQNSYLGYLTFLKEHYPRFPLIIAEFGASSSWGVAQYAQNGIHHGGYSEREQGENSIRLMKNIHQAGGGGGIQFAFMDEWFKRTWITDPLDFNPERRILWHNVTAAEQNFGIIGFQKSSSNLRTIQEFSTSSLIQSVSVESDFDYFKLNLTMPNHISESDTVWIAFDTYDSDLGESLLPNGSTVVHRAEFCLMITNYKAELFVTQAYDLFGIWHQTSTDIQHYQSIATDGAPWNLVRWKNDVRDQEVQDIGSLRVNRLNTPPHSNDGVRLKLDGIEIRLPWTLLQFIDPSQKQVIHDDRSTPETEMRTSEGIHFSLFYRDFEFQSESRVVWENWNHALNTVEVKKETFSVVEEGLPTIPGNPIARADTFVVPVNVMSAVDAAEGVLDNDWTLDGAFMQAFIDRPTFNGLVQLTADGAFNYLPVDGYAGVDTFYYRIRAGVHWSDVVPVILQVEGTPKGQGFVELFPNPVHRRLTITSPTTIDRIEIFNALGQEIYRSQVNSNRKEIVLPDTSSGVYFARIFSGKDFQLRKFTVVK